MAQITVVFFTEEVVNQTMGGLVIGVANKMVRHEIATGKTTVAEAFDVAVANGHNPNNHIRFITK